MASGGSRCKAIHHREAWLSLCGPCNQGMHDRVEWPIARQLAYKLINDFPYFDPALVCELRGNAVTYCTHEDVFEWIEVKDG